MEEQQLNCVGDDNQDGVDWDALNQQNAQKIEQELSPEEEKKQAQIRKQTFTYEQARSYFFEQADIEDEIRQIQETKEVIEV